MAFKTTLFNLLDGHGVQIVVDGFEIETVQDYGAGATNAPVRRCECDEDNDWYFADQEVVVNDDGQCTVMTAPGDWDSGMEPFAATLEFHVLRPVVESDIVIKPSSTLRKPGM